MELYDNSFSLGWPTCVERQDLENFPVEINEKLHYSIERFSAEVFCDITDFRQYPKDLSENISFDIFEFIQSDDLLEF